MHQSVHKPDLSFDFFAPEPRRGRQCRELVECPSELCRRFDQSRPLQRALSGFTPQGRGLLDQPSFSVVTRQQLGLVLGDFGELALHGFGKMGVKQASWLAQQRAIGRVLH
jgi:hypothetical protein